MKSALTLSLLALLLGACQATSFQLPPLAPAPCDPQLVGDWHSVDSDGQEDRQLQLRIAADCQLVLADLDKGQVRQSAPTRLTTGQDAAARYAWIPAGWANQHFQAKDLSIPAEDVYVYRYRVEGDRMVVETIDHTTVAHLIIDRKLDGAVISDEDRLVNRITGTPQPATLLLPGLFDADTLQFRRAGALP